MKTCKNLKKRAKNYKPYFYCTDKKNVITLDECKNCSNRIFVQNKPIKKISSNKVSVFPITYEDVMKRDEGKCRLCGCTQNLQLHHIIYRSEDKSKINDVNNCIMLCLKCHKLVHTNKKKYKPILQDILNSQIWH